MSLWYFKKIYGIISLVYFKKIREELDMKDKYNLTLEQNIFLAKRNLVDNIYANARMEGLNITFPETKTILEGVNVPNLKIDEIQCILNLRDAWKYLINNIHADFNLDFICKINELVARNESIAWGVLRQGKVQITGTDYIPEIPSEEKVKQQITHILQIENATERAIEYMLYGMRSQLFWDGNKRTSTICANNFMIENLLLYFLRHLLLLVCYFLFHKCY